MTTEIVEFDSSEELEEHLNDVDEEKRKLGHATPKPTEIRWKVVEREDGTFGVHVTYISWHVEVQVLTRRALAQAVPEADWRHYDEIYRHMSEAEFYHSAPFVTYEGLLLHEMEHARQLRMAGQLAVEAWAKRYNEDPSNQYSKEDAEALLKIVEERSEERFDNLKLAIWEQWRAMYPPGAGFRPEEHGEEDAVMAERQHYNEMLLEMLNSPEGIRR